MSIFYEIEFAKYILPYQMQFLTIKKGGYHAIQND